jgi:hypothetical protein
MADRFYREAPAAGAENVGDVPRDWLIGKLKKIANTGQSIEPDHWKYRCMARETAQEVIDKLERR